MPSNIPKSLLAVTIAFLSSNLAPAQGPVFSWRDLAEWRQTGPNSSFYMGGNTGIYFQDGSWSLSACFQPSTTIISPNIFCPLGTTGFIAQGDVDFDGVNDQGSFWSIDQIARASVIEPFRPDQFLILSAPPSGIADALRESNGDIAEIFEVIDTSVIIWYNVLASPPDDYEITVYQAYRPYGPGKKEEQRHFDDVPWGTYLFTLPQINSIAEPPRPVPFAVDHLVIADAFPGRGVIPRGWKMTNDEWYNEELEFDPRMFHKLEWGGVDTTNTLATDSLRFSARAHQFVEDHPVRGPITRVERAPDFLLRGTVTGMACETIATNLNLDSVLDQGKNYELNIISGELKGTIHYPVTVFGTGGGLSFNELNSPTVITGTVVTGSFTAANGLALSTNRDLQTCLNLGASFELTFTSGALAGTTQFPISIWNGMDLTTLVDVSASIVAGDTFRLDQKQVAVPSTVQNVAGFFVEGDLDLTSLVPGGDYRIEVTSGALAGSIHQITNFGFPTSFFFETESNLMGSLLPGDTYGLRTFTTPGFSLKVGDLFSLSQTFEDWIQDKYDAGEVIATDELTLRADPDLFPGGWNINAGGPGEPTLAELEVDVGLLGPLYAVSRKDAIVFPPYTIHNPASDRSEFILGTFDGKYELGPFFFREGDSMRGRLHMSRSFNSGGPTTNNARRTLNFDVSFIDTYAGFAILGGLVGDGFPFGTSSSERAPSFDFDHDGASNLMEFALMTSVVDPTDKPAFQYALDVATGLCTASITKRPSVGSQLSYFFEYSTDLVNWTTILPGDPSFAIVQDDETTLTVTNTLDLVGNFPPPSCFLRVKIELR